MTEKTALYKFFITFSCWILLLPLYSQVQPVTVTTTLMAPYSLYLSDYVAAGSQKLMVNLNFNDFMIVYLLKVEEILNSDIGKK